MKAGRRLIFTGILIYPLALLMCLMLARGARGPLGANQPLLALLYLIACVPLAIIVAGLVLMQKNR
jgi:hypothetical protein